MDSSSKGLVEELTLYVLAHFREDLERLRLREAVRATYYGIQINVTNFYAIFELYCPATGTFFTPVGELGMALHEMWEVSALPMGSLPYEKYFPLRIRAGIIREIGACLVRDLQRADVPLLHLLGCTWWLLKNHLEGG